MSECDEELTLLSAEPTASCRYNKGPLAAKIDELIESVMRSGFGMVIIRIVNYRVKEVEDSTTHRL